MCAASIGDDIRDDGELAGSIPFGAVTSALSFARHSIAITATHPRGAAERRFGLGMVLTIADPPENFLKKEATPIRRRVNHSFHTSEQ